MSHANGQVHFQDGLILHVEYNGTCDVYCTRLFKTHSEMYAEWRANNSASCSCGKDEPVELATDYADRYSVKGRACRHCMAITFDPYRHSEDRLPDEAQGLPEWWV